jgi:hypothetical protein
MQQTKEDGSMAKAKKGEYLSCNECGLVVVVDEACGCATADIICCDTAMVPGKAAANKAKKKAAAKKPAVKAKAAAKAKPAKRAAAKAKPAAKKPARAKK